MLKWLGPHKVPEAARKTSPTIRNGDKHRGENVTDDPLATIETSRRDQKTIYSVSRSVFLPRVSLKNCTFSATESTAVRGGINPLFLDNPTNASQKAPPSSPAYPTRPPRSREKSSSSGYGDSNTSSFPDQYQEHLKLMEEVGVLLEQNPAFVKSIQIAARGVKSNKSVPFHSTPSGEGTLTTIPEGKVDLPIPKPIWPLHDKKLLDQYDSIVDDALLLYTSLSYRPESVKPLETCIDISVKDLLLEILNGINETLEGRNTIPPENMLKIIDERIRVKLDVLKASTEEEMKRLCINLANCRKKNSALRALSNNSSSSGNSSKTSSSRNRTISSENEEVYELPSRSSSSGFSDSLKDHQHLPVFVHDNLVNVPNIVRNALIYGTICRSKAGNEGLLKKSKKIGTLSRKTLTAMNDSKPSVWEQYYGVKSEEGEVRYPRKPTDVPLYPGGRPEADFTLDVPRSEHLMKRMKKDKKWRCRCRLLTSFFGLVFFLLSVMAVSLILTRGKRMFGSMV